MSLIDRVLAEARNKLLDTGTRNRLIHVNRKDNRSNALNVINELSDEVFRQLHSEGRRMRFKAMGRDKDESDDEVDALFPEHALGEAGISIDRQTDNFLETPLGSKALSKRLLRLAADSRVAEEETGLNILYLALGFLKWREDKASSIEREAPLILLPVELVRNERTSTFDIKTRDDEISTNLPLAARLKQDFGLVLPDVPEAEEWCPSDYFEKVALAISGQPNWSLDTNGMQLGFFSFAKLLMHRDLAPETWPEGSFSDGKLISGLLEDGFSEDRPFFGSESRLDDLLDPAEIIQVVDADASQTRVIEEVRRGASLVVQGPPGTGKSQTITNLIAAAVHDGKSVLFVAEKMAALSVVHDRLVRTGLRDICIELHSRSSNKKSFSQELKRTLAASTQEIASFGSVERLRAARDRLNKIAELLHEPLGAGTLSPFEALSRISWFVGNEVEPPSVSLEGLGVLTEEAREKCAEAIYRFSEACETVGRPEDHPFFGVLARNLQPTDLERSRPELVAAAQAVDAFLNGISSRVASALGCEPASDMADAQKMITSLEHLGEAPDSLVDTVDALYPVISDQRLMDALQVGLEFVEILEVESSTFTDLAWLVDGASMRAALLKGQSSFFSRLGGRYRGASAELGSVLRITLPSNASARRELADRIIQVQAKRQRLSEEEAYLKPRLGDLWRGERTDFARLVSVIAWLSKNAEFFEAGSSADWKAILQYKSSANESLEKLQQESILLQEKLETVVSRFRLDLRGLYGVADVKSVPLQKLSEKARSIEAALSRYWEWSDFRERQALAIDAGAERVVSRVLSGLLAPQHAVTEYRYACAEAAWTEARRVRPELNVLASEDRHQLVKSFRSLEARRFEEMRDEVLAKHYAQVPKGSMGEMGIIWGEIARKRGHKSIRSLMKSAGRMVQRIKPVFLMSPLSVAQFLPPGDLEFDLLVIDEASQIKPEDALGVVARTKQIVVVGDQKQLPPTSFFDRMANSPEENDDEDAPVAASASDMESILTLCEARGLRSRMLEWHYRSRDPSLIRVSNAEFYEGNLVLPPSPLELDEDFGLKFTYVPGSYSSKSKGNGRAGTNKIEALAVAEAVAKHARKCPSLSLGVVTFSKSQADMMNEILDHMRRLDPVLDQFLREGQSEDFFVKNIENVQGDERDVILISVGYGPMEPGGRLASMNFGPVNSDGGGAPAECSIQSR